jgi:hypothetical protein
MFCRKIPSAALSFIATYLCSEKHRQLVRNIYDLHDTTTSVGAANADNATTMMKRVYPKALEFGEIRKRRFEREARTARSGIGHAAAADERERDLARESLLLHECSLLCDLAIMGGEATRTYEEFADLETELARAGMGGDPFLSRSRMVAWKAARKKGIPVRWVNGAPTVARNHIKVTGRMGAGRQQQHQQQRGPKPGGKGRGAKACNKCSSKTHLAAACPHKDPQPGSYWFKRAARKKKK